MQRRLDTRQPLNGSHSNAILQRRHLWGSRPSLWLAVSSVADIVIASTLAVGGIAMTPLPASVVAGALAAAVAFAFVLDAVKVPVFARLHRQYHCGWPPGSLGRLNGAARPEHPKTLLSQRRQNIVVQNPNARGGLWLDSMVGSARRRHFWPFQ